MKREDIYKDVTDRLVDLLNEGLLPWRKSWNVGLPRNYISKKIYNGINYIKLCLDDYPSPYYLTYLQCKELNGYVLKGEKSKKVIFWKPMTVEEELPDGTIKEEQFPILRISNIFNISQTSLYRNSCSASTESSIIKCAELEEKLGKKFIIKRNYNRCYYNATLDYISTPKISDFNSDEDYYSALFHEAAHATGNPKRLKRQLDYAEEELVAEITASFLSAYCGIENKTIRNNAAYISSWLKLLKKDSSFIARISSLSRQATNYILYE